MLKSFKNSQINLSEVSIKSSQSRFNLILKHILFADFITSFYFVSIYIYHNKTKGKMWQDGPWWEQSVQCKSVSFVFLFGSQLSFFTLNLAALERYLTFRYREIIDRYLTKSWIAFVAVFALTNSLTTSLVVVNSNNNENS